MAARTSLPRRSGRRRYVSRDPRALSDLGADTCLSRRRRRTRPARRARARPLSPPEKAWRSTRTARRCPSRRRAGARASRAARSSLRASGLLSRWSRAALTLRLPVQRVHRGLGRRRVSHGPSPWRPCLCRVSASRCNAWSDDPVPPRALRRRDARVALTECGREGLGGVGNAPASGQRSDFAVEAVDTRLYFSCCFLLRTHRHNPQQAHLRGSVVAAVAEPLCLAVGALSVRRLASFSASFRSPGSPCLFVCAVPSVPIPPVLVPPRDSPSLPRLPIPYRRLQLDSRSPDRPPCIVKASIEPRKDAAPPYRPASSPQSHVHPSPPPHFRTGVT